MESEKIVFYAVNVGEDQGTNSEHTAVKDSGGNKS